jgi:receptor protein-tyrosine kinase
VELIDYVRIVRRRWLTIFLVLIACVGGAAVATKLTTPKYQASTQLVVNGSSSVSAIDEVTTRELAEERAVAFAQIAATGPAVQAALNQAQAAEGPFSRSGFPSVSASASGTNPFIEITVTDSDARRAQAVANAFVEVLPQVLQQLDQPIGPNEIEVLDRAGYPTSPSSPRPFRNLIIGLALGIVLGGGAALVQDSLDRRLKDSEDVENATGMTVLGVVPYEMPRELIPAATHPMSVRAEAYRKVRTNLNFATSGRAPKSIVVTSSTSSEGKTSVAVNLAIACARAGQRVALVDADLRRPMVHAFLQLPDHKGLVDILSGTAELADAIQIVQKGRVAVLVAGSVPANPSELIGSATMLDVIKRLERECDMVIIDTPPVLPVADGLLLSVNVDAVVIVTRLGETTRDRLRRTKEALDNVRANVVGVVPNGAVQREDSAYAYEYRSRSSRRSGTTAYAPRDPQVDPSPKDLRPAKRSATPHDPPPPPSGPANGHRDDKNASLGKHFRSADEVPAR